MLWIMASLTKFKGDQAKRNNKHKTSQTFLIFKGHNCSLLTSLRGQSLILLDLCGSDSLHYFYCLGQTLLTYSCCPSRPRVLLREKEASEIKLEVLHLSFWFMDFFFLILSINEWWKPVQKEALLLRQTACVSQLWPRAHTHFASSNLSLSCRGEPRVHYGSGLKAEAGGWKIIMFFLFRVFLSQVSESSNLFSAQINQRRWWGVFHSCVKKRLLWLFSFWLLWWCKVLQFDLFFKDYSFWKKIESNHFHGCESKEIMSFFCCFLLFFTEPQVPKFSQPVGQDARWVFNQK